MRGQFPHSEAKTGGIALGLVVKNSFLLIIDLPFQYKDLHFHIPAWHHQEGFSRPIPSPPNPLQAPERNVKIKFQAIFN